MIEIHNSKGTFSVSVEDFAANFYSFIKEKYYPSDHDSIRARRQVEKKHVLDFLQGYSGVE